MPQRTDEEWMAFFWERDRSSVGFPQGARAIRVELIAEVKEWLKVEAVEHQSETLRLVAGYIDERFKP